MDALDQLSRAVHNGLVTLDGEVSRSEERNSAPRCAMVIRGVETSGEGIGGPCLCIYRNSHKIIDLCGQTSAAQFRWREVRFGRNRAAAAIHRVSGVVSPLNWHPSAADS